MQTAQQLINEVISNGGKVAIDKTTRGNGFFRINDETTVRVHVTDPAHDKLVKLAQTENGLTLIKVGFEF